MWLDGSHGLVAAVSHCLVQKEGCRHVLKGVVELVDTSLAGL